MISTLHPMLLLDSDSAINRWFEENPLIAGLIFLALGVVLFITGLRQLRSGVATDKYGIEYSGKKAKFISIVRLVGGVAAAGFGVYTMIFGLG